MKSRIPRDIHHKCNRVRRERNVSQTQCDSPPAAVEILTKDGEVWVFELGHHELVQNGLSVFATLSCVVGKRN
jgi:hypothetical protein